MEYQSRQLAAVKCSPRSYYCTCVIRFLERTLLQIQPEKQTLSHKTGSEKGNLDSPMSYQLNQTPVPPWAEHFGPISVDVGGLPPFLRPASAPPGRFGSAGRSDDRERGRWNTLKHSQNRGFEVNGTDPGLLYAYNLSEKWVNELEPVKSPSIAYVAHLFDFSRRRRVILGYLRKNPYVPLILRGTAWAFSVIALGFACIVYVESAKHVSSTMMAIVVMCISVPYLSFSIWDEFFGQPLGLRTPASKMKFIMIDTVLLCLLGACLSLNFDTLINATFMCNGPETICNRERCLVAFLFLALSLWFASYSVSIFRMVDRAQH